MSPRIETSQGEVIGVPPSDAEMKLASREARQTFSRFIDTFRKNDPNCSVFIVKAFFPDPKFIGGGEHLWVSVHSVAEDMATGVITSCPLFITTVKAGDMVDVQLSQLSDWLFVQKGKAVGAYTVQLLRNRMTPEQRVQHDSAYPFTFD